MEAYDVIFRHKVEEDNLYMKRLAQLLALSVAMFAGFGYVADQQVIAAESPMLGVLICAIIAALGVAAALLFGNRMNDATVSRANLEQRARDILKAAGKEFWTDKEGNRLPEPTGLNARDEQGYSSLRKMGTGDLPTIIAIAWVALFIVVASSSLV